MTTELKVAVADYIASMATEMAKLAVTHDLATVAYVLEVAAAEASDNKRSLEPECKSGGIRSSA
jgi:hypothetical protein